MKCRIFSGVKQFWQLNIYIRHFLSQTAPKSPTHVFLVSNLVKNHIKERKA